MRRLIEAPSCRIVREAKLKKQLQYISILNHPWKFILLYYSVFKFKVSIFQRSRNALNALSSMRHQEETVNDNTTFETCLFYC